jgi:hypothetical protein
LSVDASDSYPNKRSRILGLREAQSAGVEAGSRAFGWQLGKAHRDGRKRNP